MPTDRTIIETADADAIGRAAGLLRAGELVAFPTETVYGLGADATSTTAVEAIFAAKGRPAGNPLISHVADAEADLDHLAGALVAHDQRHRARPGAVHHAEIGMAEPAARDLDQQFAGAGWVQLDLFDADRPAFRVGSRRIGAAQHGGLHHHGVGSSVRDDVGAIERQGRPPGQARERSRIAVTRRSTSSSLL